MEYLGSVVYIVSILTILVIITAYLVHKYKISGMKTLLFGISIMLFSIATKSEIGENIFIPFIGLAVCIVGCFSNEKTKSEEKYGE